MKVATEYPIVSGERQPRALVPLAARRQRVQPSDVADPNKLADQLTELLRNRDEVARTLGACPGLAPMVFPDVACGVMGETAIQIAHGFGRPAMWHVIRWHRTTPGGFHGLEEETNDAGVLVLRSYVAGMATVMVF